MANGKRNEWMEKPFLENNAEGQREAGQRGGAEGGGAEGCGAEIPRVGQKP